MSHFGYKLQDFSYFRHNLINITLLGNCRQHIGFKIDILLFMFSLVLFYVQQDASRIISISSELSSI